MLQTLNSCGIGEFDVRAHGRGTVGEYETCAMNFAREANLPHTGLDVLRYEEPGARALIGSCAYRKSARLPPSALIDTAFPAT